MVCGVFFVGTGDRWQVTCDRQQGTYDTYDTNRFFFIFLVGGDYGCLILVFLTAHIKQFRVSCVHGFDFPLQCSGFSFCNELSILQYFVLLLKISKACFFSSMYPVIKFHFFWTPYNLALKPRTETQFSILVSWTFRYTGYWTKAEEPNNNNNWNFFWTMPGGNRSLMASIVRWPFGNTNRHVHSKYIIW